MAAGQDLEPYWDVYRQHLRGHVVEWMEKYRIGNLSPEEAAANKNIPFGDMFETDPVRHKDILHCTHKPFNGEPKIELLTDDYFTPNELFNVRNHFWPFQLLNPRNTASSSRARASRNADLLWKI